MLPGRSQGPRDLERHRQEPGKTIQSRNTAADGTDEDKEDPDMTDSKTGANGVSFSTECPQISYFLLPNLILEGKKKCLKCSSH